MHFLRSLLDLIIVDASWQHHSYGRVRGTVTRASTMCQIHLVYIALQASIPS